MSFGLLFWIALGGGAGAVTRFLLSKGVQEATGSAFPLGTLLVNVLGCLAIGFLAERLALSVLIREEHRLGLLVGLLGGLTTFSSFSWETLGLFTHGHLTAGILNVVLTNVLCLLGVFVGWRLAVALSGG